MNDLDSWLTKAFSEWRTGESIPFQWQRRAFHDLVAGKLPTAVDIPTGCGKTSILVLWVLALVAQRLCGLPITLPRRLAWVVHRRTVVDQTTDVALRIQRLIDQSTSASPWTDVRDILANERAYPLPGIPILPVSTIRGALAEHPAWRVDPARPAIVIGTVDKLGSRLLFQGYGDGRWGRSFYAGLLGTDTWVLLDEAHLVPAFSDNLKRVQRARRIEPSLIGVKPMHMTLVSATLHARHETDTWRVLPDDNDPPIAERITARKTVYPLKAWGSNRPTVDQLSQFVHTLAAGTEESRSKLAVLPNSGRRIVVFVQSPQFAAALSAALLDRGYAPNRTIGLLTGQLRGYERDRLAESSLFARFKQEKDADDGTSHILVCTSAGEVGVDFSADHAVVESCYLDALIQRFGRVNRYGKTQSTIWLFEAAQHEQPLLTEIVDKEAEQEPTEQPASREENNDQADSEAWGVAQQEVGYTLPPRSGLLKALGGSKKSANASPVNLTKAWAMREAAFLRMPQSFARIDDDVLNLLSATSFDEPPTSMPIDLYLHGERSDPPEANVIWRAELDLLSDVDVEPNALGLAVDRIGVHQGEIIRLPTNRLRSWLITLSDDRARSTILARFRGRWISGPPRDIGQALTRQRASDTLIVLPPAFGGLGPFGEFSAHALDRVSDIFDIVDPDAQRVVETNGDLLQLNADTGTWVRMRNDEFKRVGKLSLGESRTWFLRFCPDFRRMAGHGDFSLLAEERMALDDHHRRALRGAELMLSRLLLPEDKGASLKCGTGHHDDGKRHPLWQRAVGGSEQAPIAKAPRIDGRLLQGYRHELGSLLSAAFNDDDLALHLIAVHHGWGRPHFLPKHYDVRYAEDQNHAAVAAQLERFRRLEQDYGRWTLAYLEALLKCADVYGSLRHSRG